MKKSLNLYFHILEIVPASLSIYLSATRLQLEHATALSPLLIKHLTSTYLWFC